MDVRRVSDRFGVSSQLRPEDMALLRERGFALVINNRPDGEEAGQPTCAELAAAAGAAGIAYRAIPVTGGFSGGQLDDMARALAEAPGPVLAFCRSGTRSILLWALAQASRGTDPDGIAAAVAAAGYDIAPIRAEIQRLSAATS